MADPIAIEYDRKRRELTKRGNLSLRRLEDAFHDRTSGAYLSDVIFGANDGIVTTFAVVAGSVGANLSPAVVVILGFANLFADSLSMGLGNFLGKKSERSYERGLRKKEEWEVEHFPKIERQEIREIFATWGFAGQDLERAVAIVSRNKKVWVDFMMTEELGVFAHEGGTPFKHGLAIFGAFILAGLLPIFPFLFGATGTGTFLVAATLAGLAMFTIGALRARITPMHWWIAGLEMLAVGGIAAGVAYLIGEFLARAFGV